MALFGGNKNKDTTKKTAKAVKKTASVKTDSSAKQKVAPDVLLRPHITEKAAQATARNVFTFDIRPDATKGQVASAIHAVYGVKPTKIRMVKTPGKRVRLRTRRGFGTKNASKKAYVYLKKGDRIEFAS